ncbi:hypothetical protein ABZP36_025055 [Zizania latifolia]
MWNWRPCGVEYEGPLPSSARAAITGPTDRSTLLLLSTGPAQTNAHGAVGEWVDGKCVAPLPTPTRHYKASAAASSDETQIVITTPENSTSLFLRLASPRKVSSFQPYARMHAPTSSPAATASLLLLSLLSAALARTAGGPDRRRGMDLREMRRSARAGASAGEITRLPRGDLVCLVCGGSYAGFGILGGDGLSACLPSCLPVFSCLI